MEDDITQTRIDVAEMKGMLKQALSDHGARISSLEQGQTEIHARLSTKGKLLAGHQERIEDLEEFRAEVKADNSSRHARLIGMLGVVVAAASLIVAIANRLAIT